MPDIANFGSEDCPVRCSSAPYLIRCPARVAMLYLTEEARSSNDAADTGSAAHFAISQWHKGATAGDALRDMRENVGTFPLANLEVASIYFEAYSEDSRNPQEVVQCEWLMRFSLPPHPLDPTKRPIYFEGTCDQIRRERRGLAIHDVKTGADDGWNMANDFAPQLALYAYGASQALGEPVHMGGVIRLRSYIDGRTKKRKADKEPDGVFWESCSTVEDIDSILYRIRYEIAGIRSSYALYGPGGLCSHCPHGGLGACIPTGRMLGLTVV